MCRRKLARDRPDPLLHFTYSLQEPLDERHMRSSLACGESLIDAPQRKFPTVGRNPSKEGEHRMKMGGERKQIVSRVGKRLRMRRFSTWLINVLGGPRKRNFTKD